MTIIEPATDWMKIFEIPTFDLKEVALGNDKYIYKSSSRVSQIFNNAWICRYLCPRKVMFDERYDFKRDFTPLIKDLCIKTALKSFNKTQYNAPVGRVHQVILKILVTKYLDNKVFYYIDPWGENLAYIVWAIKGSYHLNIMAKPGQAVFGIYMLFNLT